MIFQITKVCYGPSLVGHSAYFISSPILIVIIFLACHIEDLSVGGRIVSKWILEK
jgi:hypothetical protein